MDNLILIDREWLWGTLRVTGTAGECLGYLQTCRWWIPGPQLKERPSSVDVILPGLPIRQGDSWVSKPVTAVSYIMGTVVDVP